MAILYPQTLLPNGKIDSIVFNGGGAALASGETHSFYNNGYTVLVAKAATASTLSFSERISAQTGTARVVTVACGAQAGGTSVMYGFLPRITNKATTGIVEFTVSASTDVAILQIGDVTYGAQELIKHTDILNNLTPETNATADVLSEADMDIPIDSSTIVIGAYRDTGTLEFNGLESAGDTGAIASRVVSGDAAEMFAFYPAQDAFGGNVNADASGNVTLVAVSLESETPKAKS